MVTEELVTVVWGIEEDMVDLVDMVDMVDMVVDPHGVGCLVPLDGPQEVGGAPAQEDLLVPGQPLVSL